MRIRRLTLITAVSALALSACGTTQQHELSLKIDPKQQAEFLADKPGKLKRLYARILLEGDRNAVLNYERIGTAAFEIGEDEAAGKAFDEALNRIEAVYADNAKAEAARSKFTKENANDFKGEPYERAMAYYYRGLAYLAEGDYENARASFKGGVCSRILWRPTKNTTPTSHRSLSWKAGPPNAWAARMPPAPSRKRINCAPN